MNREELFKVVLKKVDDGEMTTKEELVEYLEELKDRGVLTRGQIDTNMSELCQIVTGERNCKVGTRAPKTMDYAYSNVSAGFSRTGLLMLIAISVPVLVAMACLLNK